MASMAWGTAAVQVGRSIGRHAYGSEEIKKPLGDAQQLGMCGLAGGAAWGIDGWLGDTAQRITRTT
jgi:hypothetical protein